MRELLGGGNDDGIHFGSHTLVGIGYGSLVLEIEHIADTSDNMPYPQFAAYVHRKPVVFDYADAGNVLRSLAYDVHTLVHVIESGLVLVDADRDDHLVKHSERPAQNVEVTGREGIEGSRE